MRGNCYEVLPDADEVLIGLERVTVITNLISGQCDQRICNGKQVGITIYSNITDIPTSVKGSLIARCK